MVMKVAHRFNWHYAPPIYPEGDTQLWCKWCGFRQTIKHKSIPLVYWRMCNWAEAEQYRSRILTGSIGLEGSWDEWVNGRPERTAMNREYEYRVANTETPLTNKEKL